MIHSGNRRSLLTNEPLTSVNLVPNRTVKKMVDAQRERLEAAGARKRQRFEGDAPPAGSAVWLLSAGGMAVAALCALAAGEPEQEAFSLVKFVRSGRVSVPDANI